MSLLSGIFGCCHANTSRVFTIRNQRGKKDTYIVCLDCGKPFAYDWKNLGATKQELNEQVLEYQEGR